MRWSKVRKLVEDSFSPSIKGRVQLYSTAYHCICGRAWFTIDGEDIADLSTRASGNKYRCVYHETRDIDCVSHPAVLEDERTLGNLVEYGEFSRFDLHEACWKYLHSNVYESLQSENPLIQALAVLNGKVGRTN
ncbi:MAG: hypothetical protein JEZ00_09100 [Anaerolineaceae bacterium]|nr:hypothetical protein [Anaerolineaceae bacterium]